MSDDHAPQFSRDGTRIVFRSYRLFETGTLPISAAPVQVKEQASQPTT